MQVFDPIEKMRRDDFRRQYRVRAAFGYCQDLIRRRATTGEIREWAMR
jgi:hypothetical protein